MRLPFDRDLLRTFLAVAESGNITRAGEKVGRTQSAVSTQIKRLEDGLEEPLFKRGPRGVELTDRGKQLLPYAQRIVGLVEEAAAALRSAPLDGPVRIGIPEEYSRAILPRVLRLSPSGIQRLRYRSVALEVSHFQRRSRMTNWTLP